MGRPKRREHEPLFDPDLAEIPEGARWREWMGRVEAAIFASREPLAREVLTRLVGPRCNLDDLIADNRERRVSVARHCATVINSSIWPSGLRK
jgi:hypothetical protein